MDKLNVKIATAIDQEPHYESLKTMRSGVWGKIRERKHPTPLGLLDFTFSPLMRGTGIALLIVSCLALSQISFQPKAEKDLFDLRYFSYQALPTTDVVVASYEVKP